MTSDYVIVSIKLRPKVGNDEYIFLSKFGDRSMSDLEVIEVVSEATPGCRKRKKQKSGFTGVKFVINLISEIHVQDFCSNSSLRKPPTFRKMSAVFSGHSNSKLQTVVHLKRPCKR